MSGILAFLLKVIDIKGLISIFATLGSFIVIGGVQIGIILVLYHSHLEDGKRGIYLVF